MFDCEVIRNYVKCNIFGLLGHILSFEDDNKISQVSLSLSLSLSLSRFGHHVIYILQ